MSKFPKSEATDGDGEVLLYCRSSGRAEKERAMMSPFQQKPLVTLYQEGHLFISVLAYHLMAAILRELSEKGLNHRWETIRAQLATQVRITTSLTSEGGQRIHIRQTTDPEPFYYEVHRALGLPPKPLRTKRLRT